MAVLMPVLIVTMQSACLVLSHNVIVVTQYVLGVRASEEWRYQTLHSHTSRAPQPQAAS